MAAIADNLEELGKTDSAYKDIFDLGNTQAVFDSDFTPSATVFKWGVENHNSVHGGRPANQIRYETPDFNGISAVFTTPRPVQQGQSP